jgi:predicted aldo/keto reductase-like oxidoreductase
MAFRYAWSLPIHVMPAGMNNLEMLEQDLRYAENFTPLTAEEREQLFFDAPELGTYVCRLCNKCLPCPEGIDIPGVFKLEGWYDRQMWDGIVRDSADYALRQRLRFWFQNQTRARTAYEQVSPQADACTECGECEPRCPYHVPIVKKLQWAHQKLAGEQLQF